ncbi:MAG: cold-shock protein [Pseudomonadales bacterium]
MNPTIIRLTISLIAAIAVFFALQFTHLAGPQADIASIVTIFLGVAAAVFLSPGGNASEVEDSSEETGTVKWFNVKKGYGFITRDSGEDIFVHYRNINGSGRRAISDGQRVKFIVVDGDKGLQADEVEAI